MHSLLTPDCRAQLDAAFQRHADPLAHLQRDSRYERLFTRIALRAPAPIGLGSPVRSHSGA